MPSTNQSLGTITARIEERILQPLRANSFARRTQLLITVAAIVVLYAGLLGWLLARDAADPPKAVEAEETPVEVVAAIPPLQAPPASKPEEEKPANSAPRAFNDSEATAGEDKATRAPRAVAPDAAAPRPSAAPAPNPTDAADAKPNPTDAAKPPDVLDKDAEALDRLPPEPPRKPVGVAAAEPVPSKPVPKPPRRPKTALQQLAGASELPDYTFAKPMRRRAKVSGGTEDDRYLAVVYGMITQNRRAIRAPDADWSVAVSFVVDGGGNLVGVQVTKSSGYPEIDAAAVQSVEDAAPFPPPPSGGNTGLVARLRSLDSEAMAGGR